MSAAAGATTPMAGASRRWLVREVVQTSSMDCGPAALKSVLDGHGLEVSYGRLREACQTSIDGTSIDTLEGVARQLGVHAEQVMVPPDHVALPRDDGLPAIAVVQHADLGAHFVVLWRRVGGWVQVMDPASGRQWLTVAALRARLYRHDAEVDAAEWAEWAASDENRRALAQRLQAVGVGAAACARLVDTVAAQDAWLPWAALDAAVRLASALVDAGGLGRGRQVPRLLRQCLQRCLVPDADPDALLRVVPAAYWSVLPVAAGPEAAAAPAAAALRLRLRGAVVLRLRGRLPAGTDAAPTMPTQGVLSPELAAALTEPTVPPWRTLWSLLEADRQRAPGLLVAAAGITTLALTVELMLLRGLLDLAAQLGGTGQRLAAAAAFLVFLLLRPAWDAAALRETQRLGRQLELRLRATLLARLPRLHDRYFQSRPISDMADRAHGLQIVRAVPHTWLGMAQAMMDLALTAAVLLWLAPSSAPWVLAMAATAVALPLLVMPLLSERDLRVRTHGAALAGFYLDALLGLVPVRAHRAARAVRREHEALLVEWTRAMRRWIRGALALDALQGTLGLGLALLFLARHFQAQGGVAGSDLLLVFWTLKLPALGRRVAHLAELLPAQRNALARLLEPMSTPVAAERAATAAAPSVPVVPNRSRGVEIRIRGGLLRAGGHDILRDVDLHLAPGEQVAVVGASGAGKSSLVGLLLGWHRLADGELHVDGRPMSGADGSLDALRPHIAWVDPAVQLWNRSLLDNLLYASDDDALSRAGEVTRVARVREVAARLPQGLQTLLGEGGGLLSGGEGQRVRLARALLQRSPRLVLLDEPFRGLDRTQRRALLHEARRWWQGSTLLCVTHDIGETLDFARVLIVQDGRIVEDGDPRRLVGEDTRYRALLEAERALHAHAWSDAAWRRLELRDGRLTPAGAGAPVAVDGR